jgi:hypothetical protein
MKLLPYSSRYRISLVAMLLMLFNNPSLAQWTTNGTSIYNTNNGNVGIGTSTPWATLDVVGSGQFTSSINLTGGLFQHSSWSSGAAIWQTLLKGMTLMSMAQVVRPTRAYDGVMMQTITLQD